MMIDLTTITPIVQAATTLIRRKQRTAAPAIRRAVCQIIHVKQTEEAEDDLEDALIPFFAKQIQSAASRLKGQSMPSGDDMAVVAEKLADRIFDPEDWDEELVDRTLPPLALAQGRAASAEMVAAGFDPADDTRATTASEWLSAQDDVALEDVVFSTPQGDVSMRIATEWPDWMKESIKDNMATTFEQPYWAQVNQTTHGDISNFIKRGLLDGQSIATIAGNMESELHETGIYARRRARTIARTESGNVLNAGRKSATDQLEADLEPEIKIRAEWLSALANTTRDAHANLHGVLADEDGMWSLNGVRVPWPAHWSLPAGDRANCLCTTTTSFG